MLIKIVATTQRLIVYNQQDVIREYSISTAKKGLGENKGSEMTPRGWHQIIAKIGSNCPVNTVFVGRRATGEVYSAELGQHFPERDWILTRILWLGGLEPGFNRYGSNDTLKRFIYIHGCPDAISLHKPSSHGCIRMRNRDIIELYNLVSVKTPVLITEVDHAIT